MASLNILERLPIQRDSRTVLPSRTLEGKRGKMPSLIEKIGDLARSLTLRSAEQNEVDCAILGDGIYDPDPTTHCGIHIPHKDPPAMRLGIRFLT